METSTDDMEITIHRRESDTVRESDASARSCDYVGSGAFPGPGRESTLTAMSEQQHKQQESTETSRLMATTPKIGRGAGVLGRLAWPSEPV